MVRSVLAGVAFEFLAASTPTVAQSLGGAQAPDVSLLRVFFALLFCLAVAVAGAYALRFRMTGRLDLPTLSAAAQRRLVLIERLRLGAQHELCLIAFDGCEYLVSVSATGIARFDGFGEAAATGAA